MDNDIALAMHGDEAAYRRLVEQTAGTVCSIALAIVRNVEASEDVAQEVFLAVWTQLRKLRNPASFLPWLRQVTRNQAHLWLREHARETTPGDDAFRLVIDARPSPDVELLRDEERRVVAAVLDELPEEAREVVVLYYRENSSARHVAELLGISEDAVKQRLSRARAKMRAELLERFGGALVRTAPGAAFVTVVAASLTAAAPPASAAIAASGTTSAGGKLAVPLAALAKGSLFGAALGVAGVVIGMKRLEPHFDEQEAEELRRFRNVSVLVMIVSSIVFALLGTTPPPRWRFTPIFIIFFAVEWHLYGVRLPRILERRYQWEREIDANVAKQHRRAWMYETIGRAAGTVSTGFTFGLMLLSHCR